MEFAGASTCGTSLSGNPPADPHFPASSPAADFTPRARFAIGVYGRTCGVRHARVFLRRQPASSSAGQATKQSAPETASPLRGGSESVRGLAGKASLGRDFGCAIYPPDQVAHQPQTRDGNAFAVRSLDDIAEDGVHFQR